MLLDIPATVIQTQTDLKVINSLLKKIGGTLNTKRSADVERATQLAVYFYIVGDTDNAIQLLNCFYTKVDCDPNNTTLWFEYGCSLVLLAELLQYKGESIEEIRIVLSENDIMEGSRVTNYKDHVNTEHPEALSTAELESQKYQCGIYTTEILIILYFKHMLGSEDEKYSEQVMEDIELRLIKVKGYLKESLSKKRYSKKDRLDIHPQD